MSVLLFPSMSLAADPVDAASAHTDSRSLGAADHTEETDGDVSREASQAEGRPLVPNEFEAAIAQMIMNHPKQERPELVYDPHLHLVARAKAIDMANRRYKGHVDPDGFGPNYVVRSLGYELPKHYSAGKGANNIESFAWSSKSTRGEAGDNPAEEPHEAASRFVDMWYKSPSHKRHLLGQGFNADQTRFGIGYAQSDSDARRRGRSRQTSSSYAIFISAPPSLSEPTPLTEDIVDDHLSRTPRERERALRAGRNP